MLTKVDGAGLFGREGQAQDADDDDAEDDDGQAGADPNHHGHGTDDADEGRNEAGNAFAQGFTDGVQVAGQAAQHVAAVVLVEIGHGQVMEVVAHAAAQGQDHVLRCPGDDEFAGVGKYGMTGVKEDQ